MASPICTVADGGGAPQSTLDGVDVASGDTITIQLQTTAGVGPWAISCIGTDETNAAATITAGLTIDALNKRATFTAPAIGSALIFQSVVNSGMNADNKVDESLTTTFGIYVRTASGNRVGAINEVYESNHLYGWLVKFNQMLRASPSGTGTATYTLDSASAAVVKGNCVCVAPGGLTVTFASSAALAAAGAVLGVVVSPASPGQAVIVDVESMVPNSVTGLGTGAEGPVRVNTTTGNLQRVTSFSSGDYPVGYCNTAGDVTMVRGIIVGVAPTGTAGGALGGTYPNPTIALNANAGLTGQLDASKAAGVNSTTYAAGGALVAGNVPFVSGVAAVSYGPASSGNVPTPQVKKTANYTINLATDFEILVDTTGGAFTLTWPAHQVGGEVYIKDVGGALATNNLTLARHAAENIEGVAANRVFSAPGLSVRITDDGTNLWVNS